MLGGRPYAALMGQFRAAHRHPLNRAFHLVGIPTLALSAPLWLLAALIPGLWPVPAVMTPLGLACQFAGHAIEGNRPEVLSDRRFVLVGLVWWTGLVRGRA